MKKMIKRTSALAISAFMAAQYIPFSAVAYTTTTSDLTIHPYVISDSTYNTRKAAGSAGLTGTTSDKPASSEGLDSYADDSLTFTIISVNANGAADGVTSLTGQLSNAAINLPDGKYKITPENNDTDAKFKTAEAFYIQLPAGAERNVHIYPKFTENNDTGDNSDPGNTTTPNDPDTDTHTIKLNKSLSDAPASHNWTSAKGRAGFNAYYKNQLGNWEKIMNTAGTDAQVYYTNANGEVIIDGLPLGQYCLVEVDAPGNDDFDYMLDQKPQMFTLDGTTSTNELTLVNDPPLKVTKEIDKDGKGHTFNWTIHADLPTNRANLLSYVITDTYDADKLSVASASAVTIPDLTAADYSVSLTSGTITITIENMAALAGITGDTIDVKVVSTLSNNYSTGNVTNSAQIKYQYAYDPTGDVPDDIPDPDPTNPTNPSPTPVDYPPTTPTPAVVTPVTLTISNVDDNNAELSDGQYDISGLSTHIDDSSATATIDDGDKDDDLLTLKNLAPGVYTIKQTGTKTGYSIASPDTQTIYIDSNGLVYEGDSATGTPINSGNAGSATITFVNPQITAGFNLPFTGTTATIIFTVTGLILMAGTLFFIIILKKRDDDDEEEQENN